MFFCSLIKNNGNKRKNIRKTSLPDLLKYIDFTKDSFCKYSLKKAINCRRTSSKLSGSATLEATLIFPFIIFFFVSVIWIIDLFYVHSTVGEIINSVGNEMVTYSYPYEQLMDTEDEGEEESLLSMLVSIGFSEVYVREKINEHPASKKISGLTTLLSDFYTDDVIDIKVTYYVEPVLAIPGIDGVILTNHFYSKAFTGYKKKPKEAEEMVYITRTGTVYHTSLDCRYLKFSPQAISIEGVKNERSKDGARFYPCEICEKEGFGEIVYIMPYGNRYHNSLECFGIKVDVFEVPKSSVSDRRKCFYCE